ncbi:MAG TPA: hypothetical protein VH370_01880 [Humisphaera sp.]|nr:hypothetical protein [Humisphaera sp.]
MPVAIGFLPHVQNASLLLMSAEYGRRSRSTASHGLETHATLLTLAEYRKAMGEPPMPLGRRLLSTTSHGQDAHATNDGCQ